MWRLTPCCRRACLWCRAAEHGLQVAASEDWSSRVRGFWRVPLLQLLFRQTEAKQQLGPRLAEGLARVGGWGADGRPRAAAAPLPC
jgi:hypothetical protein